MKLAARIYPGLFAVALAGAAIVIFAGGASAADTVTGDTVKRKAAGISVATVPRPTVKTGTERVLKVGYDVYLGGLKAFAFTVDVSLYDDNYWLSGTGESKGLLSFMWKWAAGLSAGGTVGPRDVDAEIYNVETVSKRGDKLLQLSFDENGKYSIRRTPPDNAYRKSKRDLPDAIPASTTDPLSLSLRIARAVGAGGSCAGTYNVFDGDRRYDLIFTDLGKDRLKQTPYSVFAGEARRCRFDIKRIKGFKKHETFHYWDEDNLDPPVVWIARVVPDMPPVPVLLHGDLAMGGLRIYLIWAEYDGRPVYADGKRPKVHRIGTR